MTANRFRLLRTFSNVLVLAGVSIFFTSLRFFTPGTGPGQGTNSPALWAILLGAGLVVQRAIVSAYGYDLVAAAKRQEQLDAGINHFQMQRYQESILCCSTVLQNSQGNAGALFYRGQSYEQLGMLQLALFDYKLFVEKASSDHVYKVKIPEIAEKLARIQNTNRP